MLVCDTLLVPSAFVITLSLFSLRSSWPLGMGVDMDFYFCLIVASRIRRGRRGILDSEASVMA
jgi:hypothetical protein